MRKSRNGQSGLFAAITKFTVLAMCFATVFALVLTAGLLDDGSASDSVMNVAEASYDVPKTGGKTNQTNVDSFGWPSVSDVQNALHGSPGGSYTFTIDLSSVAWSGVSWVSVRTAFSLSGGQAAVQWSPGGTSGFGAKQTANCNTQYAVVAAVNITLPSILTTFAANSNYRITLDSWTADRYIFWDSSDNPIDRFGVNFSTGAVSADSMARDLLDGGSNGSTWQDIGTWESEDTSEYYPSQNASGDWGFLIKDQKFTTATEMSVGDKVLALAVGRERTAYSGGGQAIGTAVDGIKLTFTIANRNASDGQEPTAQVTTEAVSTDWTAYDGEQWKSGAGAEFLAGAENYNDNFPEGEGSDLTVGMNTITQGTKTLELALKEYGVNANGDGVAADPSAANYYAGIATVSVYEGDTTGEALATTAVSYGSAVTAEFFYTGGSGTITLTASNARSQGTLTLTFSGNTTEELIFVISDSGGASATVRVTVRGIVTQSASPDVINANLSQSETINAAQWWVKETTSFRFSGMQQEVPLLWFYAMDYSDSAVPTGGVFDSADTSALHPFVFLEQGDASAFDFNFKEGTFNGVNTDATGVENETGAGYYRFTFLAMDFTGKVYPTITYYVKVDCDPVTVDDFTLKYDISSGVIADGDTGSDGVITNAAETVWAGTPLTAEITFTPAFSGNRVQILGADGNNYYFYVTAGGKISGIRNASSFDDAIASKSWQDADGKYTMTGTGNFASVEVTFKYEGVKASFTVVYTGVDGKECSPQWNVRVYNNVDVTSTAYEGDAYANSGTPDAWSGGVPLRIDLQKPNAPTLSDADGYIAATTETPEGADRNWYTTRWDLGATLGLNIGEYSTVYYLTKYYDDEASVYAADRGEVGNALTGRKFEGFTAVKFSDHGNKPYPITLDFNEHGVGYYVTYLIAVDRAGNLSGVAEYGVLVDANTYNVSAVYAAGYADKIGSPYTFVYYKMVDGEKVETQEFKRGEELYFELGGAYAGAYVPYEIKKMQVGGGIIDTAIYTHPDLSETFVEGGILKGYKYARVEGGALVLGIDRNAITALPQLEGSELEGRGATQLVFSYRRVVNATLSSESAVYNGEHIDLTVNATFTDGTSATIEEEHLPYVVPSLPEGVNHVGEYDVTIAKRDSEYYVLSEEVGAKFNVTKASLVMSVTFNKDSYVYGEVTYEGLQGLITYTIASGLVGADKGKDFAALDGNGASFSITGEGYVPAGSNAVTAVFTANDYTVTLQGGGLSLSVTARPVAVTADGVSSTYGNDLPTEYSVSVPAFEFDSLGLFNEASEIAALFGVEAGKVSGDAESGWTVKVPAAAIANDSTRNTFGYVDAGSYNFTAFNADELEIDPNFAVSLAEEGNGTIEVSAVTVEVGPVGSIAPIRVSSADKIAEIQVNIATNSTTNKFGITGYLTLDVSGAQGENYPISTDASRLSSSHNYAESVENVIITVNTGGRTVNVTIEVASGKFVITFNADVSFSTPYGTYWNRTQLTYDGGGEGGNFTYVFYDQDGALAEAPAHPVVSVYIVGYTGKESSVLSNNVGEYPIQFTVNAFEGTDEASGLAPTNYDFEYRDADGNEVTTFRVTQREITVEDITASPNLTKVYGAMDTELNFSFRFGNLPKGVANIPVSGIYRANAEGTARGARNDDVREGGYGIWWKDYTISAQDRQNYIISGMDTVFADIVFTINPKQIRLTDSGVTVFVNQSQQYDNGDSTAKNASITLDNTVILNNDDVKVIFTAADYYNGTEITGKIGSGYSVLFTGVALDGKDTGNYELILSPEGQFIYGDGSFKIEPNPVVVDRGMFIIVKTYDGTVAVAAENVSFTEGSVFFGKKFDLAELDGKAPVFSSADAATSVTVFNLVIVFPDIKYPEVLNDEITIEDYFTTGTGITVQAVEGSDGIAVVIQDFAGVINRRVVTAGDLDIGFTAENMNKVYDNSTSVTVPFEFSKGFTDSIAGFAKADVALSVVASVSDKDAKVYDNVTVDGAYVEGVNYVADDVLAKGIEDIINAVGDFEITKRPITLEIDFADAAYSGANAVPVPVRVPYFRNLAPDESLDITDPKYSYVRRVDGKIEPFPYVQVDNLDADGNYYHDILVELGITASAGFDWNNYDIELTADAVEGASDQYTISDLFLEKAAVLNKKNVSINISALNVFDKEYDGDDKASVDFSVALEDMITAGVFYGNDKDSIALIADVAKYKSANAGNNIMVEIGGIRFIVNDESKDENKQFIADSYLIGYKASSSSYTGNITPKVLTATATLPGKTYDGTGYGGVDESKIVWELSGFFGSDANNYSVEVLAAGYDGADVAEDGNPNPGFVYGYYLVNNAQKGVMNYTIETHATKEYNVYSAKAGAEPFSAELNKIIVAEYTENGAVRYLIPVESIPTAAEGETLTPEEQALVKEIEEKLTIPEEVSLNSFPASGKIDPAQLIFTVEIVKDSPAWTKNFDDTVNVYNAKYGTPDATEGYDFKVKLEDPAFGGQALVGITLEQDDFSVSFADANVGTGKDIIFTVNVVGEQSNNNNFIFNESNSYTVKGAGTINPAGATMSVGYGSTGSIEATYGDAGSALLGFTYQLGSYNILVDADGYAYILSTQWNEAFGRDGTIRPALSLPTDRLYIRNDDGTFALITDETVSGDQYVRINGRFTDLNVLANDGSRLINADGLISAKAGTYENAKAHVVNANFDIVVGTSATVTVNKAELTVTTDKDAYDAVYWTGTMPTPVFTVASGNASFDDPAALAKAIKWAFKGKDDVAATVQSKPNSEGGSYTLTVDELDNYTVVIVNAEGAPALTITIPALDDTVYSAVASGTRPVELDTDGNAIALDETDLIRGVTTGVDEVVIKWSTTDGVELKVAPANAGSYTWTATITRKIGNYHYDGAATLEGTFEITKRNVIVSLKAGSLSFVFEEGKTYYVTASDLVAVDAETGAAVENFVNVLGIGYSKDGVSVDGMTTAGAYNLVLTMGDEFEVNYALVDRVNAIRVTPKAVTVTVEDTSKSHNVTTSDADYAGIVFDSAGFENLTVTYRDGSGKVIGSTPKTPGIYTYTISSTDPNYTVSGNTTGTIRIVVSEVSFVKDGVTYATVSFTTPVATNYVLSDTTVSPNGNYWNIIDQNVAALAGEDEVLSTSGIVRVALSAGGNHTSGFSEKVTVTARIPDGVAAGFDVYYVTASGKLAPLSELDPEFRIEGGNIVYTTDYVSNLIFVNSSAPGFNWWIIPLIAAALILILALAILIGVLVKLHRAPDPVPVEVAPIDSIMPEPPVVAPVAAAPAPVFEPAPAADIEPATYDAPAAVSKHGQPPIIGIR